MRVGHIIFMDRWSFLRENKHGTILIDIRRLVFTCASKTHTHKHTRERNKSFNNNNIKVELKWSNNKQTNKQKNNQRQDINDVTQTQRPVIEWKNRKVYMKKGTTRRRNEERKKLNHKQRKYMLLILKHVMRSEHTHCSTLFYG